MARKVTIRRGLKVDLPVLDIGELGFALDTSELFIGSEVGNILFAKKSELDLINTEINGIKESDVFTRLSISENGVLMIDGVEQSTNGGGEEMTLVVKDYFEGSTNITKTYTDSMVGFDITNDDTTTGLTFSINGLTIPVKASESYNANFAPYKTVTITTTVPYRATVSMPYGTTVDTIAPNNVTGLTLANVTETSVDLSWTASTSTDTVGYEIYNGASLVTTTSETNFSATGLSKNTNYIFTVKAKDGSGNIASGSSVSTTTLADIIAPNEITNLATNNVTATTLTLSWTASNSSDVTGYEIHKNGVLLTTITGANYNVSGLTASTEYTFIVKSKDNSNNISTGVSTTVTTSAVADTTAPENVANLTTSNLSTTSVTLNWNASISPDVTGYDIYNGATLVTNTASTSYTVTGLDAATQYTFTIKAKDGANNIASGTSATITTVDNIAPNNVSGLTTSNITQTGLTLTWTASDSSDIASYEIYNGVTLINAVTGTTYNVSDLTASTTYTFTVKAKDTANNVAIGTSVNVTTLAIDTETPPEGVATTGLQLYKGGIITNGTTVDVDGSQYLVGNGDWTLAMTVKPSAQSAYLFNIMDTPLYANPSTTTAVATNTQNKYFISSEPDGAILHRYYMTEPAPDPDTYFSGGAYSTGKLTDTSIFYHVLAMRSGTSFKLYINGVLSGTTSAAFSTRYMNASTRPVIIGDSTKNVQVKNLTIYNRALSDAEITSLYNTLK